MQFIKVLLAGEVKEGEKQKVTLGDKVLLISNVHGEFHAIDDRCPHMGGSLYEGVLIDR